MSFQSIPLKDFEATFGSLTEVSSESLGGTIVSVSDDFFSPASDLLKTGPAVAYPGVFNKNGSVMDGWESRRHNPNHDWVIIKLGPPSASIQGFDIDTTHFSGNEAPAASVDALFSPDTVPPNDSPLWTSLLLPQPLGPSSRHLFKLTTSSSSSIPFTHLRLNNIPDGGIARFRVYGDVVAPHPSAGLHAWDRVEKGETDLAHSFNGGHVVAQSDEHYGGARCLLLPGRGETMADGWHTKRSRIPGHSDSVIIKLGSQGTITEINIDTLHFIGNFPAGVAVHAVLSEEEIPSLDSVWTQLIGRSTVGAHNEHFFQVDNASKDQIFSHCRMTIFPDGGVKRLRVYGHRAA